MPFQQDTFLREQDFTRDRTLGGQHAVISADKVDAEFDNVAVALTSLKTDHSSFRIAMLEGLRDELEARQRQDGLIRSDVDAEVQARQDEDARIEAAAIAAANDAYDRAVAELRDGVDEGYDTLAKLRQWSRNAFNDRYTKADADARFVNANGDAIDGQLSVVRAQGSGGDGDWNEAAIVVEGANGSGAFMSFHRPGDVSLKFGLDVDNQLGANGRALAFRDSIVADARIVGAGNFAVPNGVIPGRPSGAFVRRHWHAGDKGQEAHGVYGAVQKLVNGQWFTVGDA